MGSCTSTTCWPQRSSEMWEVATVRPAPAGPAGGRGLRGVGPQGWSQPNAVPIGRAEAPVRSQQRACCSRCRTPTPAQGELEAELGGHCDHPRGKPCLDGAEIWAPTNKPQTPSRSRYGTVSSKLLAASVRVLRRVHQGPRWVATTLGDRHPQPLGHRQGKLKPGATRRVATAPRFAVSSTGTQSWPSKASWRENASQTNSGYPKGYIIYIIES